MLGIFVISGCVLMTCAGPPMSGYSLGTLSGGRGQEYSGGYRTGGFVGMKDSQGEYVDNTGSHRYSVVTGGSGHSSSPGSGNYSPDSGYSDSSLVGSQASGAYQGQTNLASPDSVGSLSSSSYSSDTSAHVGTSSDLGGASYSALGTSSSSGVSGGYSTGGSSGSPVSSFAGYNEAPGVGHGVSSLSPGNERVEYSSSHPSNSYVTYTIGGPKASAYTSTKVSHGRDHHVHGIGSYSSGPSAGFSAGGHRGISPSSLSSSSSSSSSSYPSETSHPLVSSGSGYSSGPSLNSFLAGMHGNNGPSNYIQHGSGGSNRGSPGHHIFASATNPSPGYVSRIPPNSGYYTSNGPYTRGGGGGGGGGSPGKIIIVKESNVGHHSGHAYPGEQHGYVGGIFAGSNSGYKIRNIGSGTSHGSPSFTSGYSSPGGYNVASSAHSGNNHGGSFFGFL